MSDQDQPAGTKSQTSLINRIASTGLKQLYRGIRTALPSFGLLVVLLIVWELSVRWFGIRSFILPLPEEVISGMLDMRWNWFEHAWVTTIEALGGFVLSVLLGIFLGIVVTWTETSRRAVLPFLVVLNSLPKIAMAPLFIIWLGWGILPNMVIGFLVAFFPVVLNTARGLEEINQDFLDLASSLDVPRWRVFWQIRLPNAMPYIFTGVKIASTWAMVGAIVGEFIAAEKGLASLIISAQATLSTDIIIGALIWISIITMVLYGMVVLVEWILMPWTRVG